MRATIFSFGVFFCAFITLCLVTKSLAYLNSRYLRNIKPRQCHTFHLRAMSNDGGSENEELTYDKEAWRRGYVTCPKETCEILATDFNLDIEGTYFRYLYAPIRDLYGALCTWHYSCACQSSSLCLLIYLLSVKC